MNILVITPYFAPYKDVASRRMISLVKFLIALNNKITVVKLQNDNYPSNAIGEEYIDGARYIEFDVKGKTFKESEKILENILDNHCEQNSYDIIIVSCGPFFTVTPTKNIGLKYNIPYIMDYRDLWLYKHRPNDTLKKFFGNIKSILLFNKAEKEALKHCAKFVSVTNGCVRIMEKHYSFIKGKTSCIYNGYEEEIVEEKINNTISEGKYNLVIFGKLSYYSEEKANLLIKAIAQLINTGYDISITHIGKEEPVIKRILSENAISSERYRCLGLVDYASGMAHLKNSDVSISVIDFKIGLGTKLFDYIRINKPIVALAPPDSEYEEILSQYENAFICQTLEDITNALEKIFSEDIKVLATNNTEQYSRKMQNEIYYKLIESSLAE